jgi:hypothetical protein
VPFEAWKGSEWKKKRNNSMPGPKECLKRAFEYVGLAAQVPASPLESEAYLNVAKILLRLANDLERSQHLVEERNEPRYKKAS